MNYRQFFTTNQWWGKLIGCLLGYLMARSPVGALIGIIIGNFFDRGLAQHFSNIHSSYHEEKRKAVQKIFFEATFTVMGHVAKADGRVSELEIEEARKMMDEMRLSREQKQQAKELFNRGKKEEFDLYPLLTSLQNACRDNLELLKLFIDIQYRYAQVDGLSEKKLTILDTVFKRLGFAPLNQQYRFYEDFNKAYTRNRQRYYSAYERFTTPNDQTSLTQAYAILEINPTASKQEVKRAYRRLISKNHPDKLIAKGLPESMIKIANDKTQKITKAYEQICTAKGW
jgi:DnaJ like chaperone protein